MYKIKIPKYFEGRRLEGFSFTLESEGAYKNIDLLVSKDKYFNENLDNEITESVLSSGRGFQLLRSDD